MILFWQRVRHSLHLGPIAAWIGSALGTDTTGPVIDVVGRYTPILTSTGRYSPTITIVGRFEE